MGIGLAFWIIMLVWAITGGMGVYNAPAGQTGWHTWGGSLMLFILLALLGWQAFGPALHG